jgi:hypothetical protein
MDDKIPFYKYASPMAIYLKPPKHSKPITADGFEINPKFINLVKKEPFSKGSGKNPYPHMRKFKQFVALFT